jgi:hypothetical protein
VPLVGAAAVVVVDAEGVTAVYGGHGGVGDRGAEQAGERLVAVGVEVVLVAEEDDLVLEDRGADRGHGGLVQVAAEADSGDHGAEAAADLLDGESGGLGD